MTEFVCATLDAHDRPHIAVCTNDVQLFLGELFRIISMGWLSYYVLQKAQTQLRGLSVHNHIAHVVHKSLVMWRRSELGVVLGRILLSLSVCLCMCMCVRVCILICV